MSLKSRIEALEQRRGRGGHGGPLPWLWARYDDAGDVIACEVRTIPLKLDPTAVATLGPIVAGFAAMKREPRNRASCDYDDCKYRDTCRADGSPVTWNSPTLTEGA